VYKPAQFNKSNGDNLLKMALPVDNCWFMPEPSTGKKDNSLPKIIIFRSTFERLFQHMQLLVEFVCLNSSVISELLRPQLHNVEDERGQASFGEVFQRLQGSRRAHSAH
jgi:hypothetical protein